MAKVPVYRKDTGERVYIPEHWLDNKNLSKPFRKTPPTTGGTTSTTTPASGDKKES
jgi:hypothetical protein